MIISFQPAVESQKDAVIAINATAAAKLARSLKPPRASESERRVLARGQKGQRQMRPRLSMGNSGRGAVAQARTPGEWPSCLSASYASTRGRRFRQTLR